MVARYSRRCCCWLALASRARARLAAKIEAFVGAPNLVEVDSRAEGEPRTSSSSSSSLAGSSHQPRGRAGRSA